MQKTDMTLPVGSVARDRYIVEALLGKGGFGAVYRVRDLRVKSNLFALKEVIIPDISRGAQKDRQRFSFESGVLSRLEHRALPRVYWIFEDEEQQRAYMLMDYIEGPNLELLRQRQPGKRLEWSRVLSIMAPIFDAVSYLHRQEPPILHRDIKPANIIVPPENTNAVLVDFDIAKEYEPDSTTTAIRRCSPGYGAPEQYSQGTNTRTDIYGLGATIYALLTGIVPPDAFTRMTQIGGKRSDPLLPIEQLVSGVPAQIIEAVKQALAIDSRERFATVDLFWQALDAHATAKEPAIPKGKLLAPVVAAEERSLAAAQPAALPQKDASKITTAPSKKKASVAVPQARKAGKRRFVVPVVVLLTLLVLLGSAAGLWFTLAQQQAARSVGLAPGSHTTPGNALSPTQNPQSQTSTAVPGNGTPASNATAVSNGQTPVVGANPTTAPRPTAQPTATSAPPQNPYPVLKGAYNGTLVDTTPVPNIPAVMILSTISQDQKGKISGNFSVDAPLAGNGPFSGTIGTNKYLQFTVPSYKGAAPLFFWGFVQTNHSLKGQYCSLDQSGHCSASAGGGGYWNVAPTLLGS